MLTRLLKALPLGALIALLGVIVSLFQFAHELEEDLGLGLLFKMRGPRKPPPQAVVISIDKESAYRLQILSENPDKWPRSLHARLVDVLTKAGAAVVTFDLHFLEARDAKDDKLFAAALARARNVVLSNPMTTREIAASPDNGRTGPEHSLVRIVPSLPLLAESAVATAPFVLPRIPFKVNQYWTFQSIGALVPPATFPVIAYQLFARHAFGDFIRLLEKLRPNLAGKLPQSLDASMQAREVGTVIRKIKDIFEQDPALAGEMITELQSNSGLLGEQEKLRLMTLVKLYAGPNRRYINYYGPPHTVTTIPYHRALQLGEGEDGVRVLDLKDKAVFVGLSERILAERKDSFYTVFSQANGVFIGGVEIAATAFLNMLEDRVVNPIGSQAYLVLLLLWGLAAGIICRMSSIMLGAAAVVGLGALYFAGSQYHFSADGTWYPIVIPLFVQGPSAFVGAVIWNYAVTNKERQQIRKALAYYVPDEVVDQLAKNMVDIKNSGQMVYGACLFADVAGYTALSEKMTPQQLSALMHKYFEASFEAVKRHGGMVVNLKGDSFLAIWKAARPDHSLRRQACLAAIDVAQAVHRFNSTVEDFKFPTRVGVHSGEIFLGNIGAGDHYEYGPTGDTVNTASRMDGLNKYLGTEVLVSEESIARVEGLVAREVGKFMLKGKAQPIVAHELLGRLDETDDKQKKACAMFADALAAFRRQSWKEAAERFSRMCESSNSDGPEAFYLKLCEQYEKNPPPETWDGIVVLEEK